MNRTVLVGVSVVLTLIDAAIHLRRSLLPSGNPFDSPLHQQFLLYVVVAVVLAVAMLGGLRWLGARAWIAAAALLVWEAGAIAVWLVAYHAPNPPGVLPDEGYTSKFIELLNVLVLLTIVRMSFSIRQPAALRTP